MIRWDEITAAFGGTFDPPHRGHRIAVEGLLKDPGVRSVLVLPSPVPIQKTSVAAREQRLDMVRLNFERIEGVRVDTRELDRADRHPDRPAYSFDTIQELRKEFPKLAFVIGADQLQNLHTWHRLPEILRECHWIVLARRTSSQSGGPGLMPNMMKDALEVLTRWEASGLVKRTVDDSDTHSVWQTGRLATGPVYLRVTSTDAPALASTDIRKEIAVRGELHEGLLEPAVLSYLKTHRIYGIRGREKQ